MAVTLTEAAARHVTRYLGKRGKGVGVRLGVKTTGCSGLAYKLEYVDEFAPEDVVFEDHGVKVLVDPKSLAYIDGTQLDFVREGLNEGFKFNNPNETRPLRLRRELPHLIPDRLRARAATMSCAGGFLSAMNLERHRLRTVRRAGHASRRTAPRWTRAGRNCSARRIPTASRPRAPRRSAWRCSGRCASTRPTSG